MQPINRPFKLVYGKFFHKTISQGTAPFAYYLDHKGGWLLYSPGPDLDYDIQPEKMYDSTKPMPSEELINVKYDPTNGIISNGDVWRKKD